MNVCECVRVYMDVGDGLKFNFIAEDKMMLMTMIASDSNNYMLK